MIAIWLIILLVAAGLIWLAWELIHAPLGWQDEQGFHPGKPGEGIPVTGKRE